jgi:RNA 3'-terminal phosphate cyclase (ATP)
MQLPIDGSYGEGGGQILRTALALSAILGVGIRIDNIRAKRRNPGLAPQHLTCVQAAAKICGARVEGARIGSTQLTFIPGEIKPGRYLFDVAEKRPSAGSVTLIFQAIYLPLALSDGESEVILRGGTHVPWSPPAHYLQQVFVPVASRFGLKADVEISKWGFYPKGGGEIRVKIHPSKLNPASIVERGSLLKIRGISACANLPISIAERQRKAVERKLSGLGETEIETFSVRSRGPGTVMFLTAEFEGSLAGFSSLGERGKPAERVGEEAADELLEFLRANSALDPHAADQIIPIMALAGGRSAITTPRITQHLLTNVWLVERLTDVRFKVNGELDKPGEIEVIA